MSSAASRFDKATVLVVDDTPENIDVLVGILHEDYKVKVANNGERALKIARGAPAPDIILLDIMMPGMDGYEVCQQLKADPHTARIPVIFITAKDEIEDETRGFAMGCVDYITKPVSLPIVLARVKTQLELYDQERALEGQVRERTHELNETRLEVIRRLGRAAEYKDNETGLHVIRMSHYTRILANARGLSEDESELLLNAAPMHDIGKIGIPDRILLKQGPLEDEEWKIMRQHPYMGAQIIGDHDNELLKAARIIAYTHHENWDGSGYPRRLKGEEIPLYGRIIAIADVFDALTTERPYKKAWAIDDAVGLLNKEAGRHFDPGLVPVFVEALPDVLAVRDTYGEHSGIKAEQL